MRQCCLHFVVILEQRLHERKGFLSVRSSSFFRKCQNLRFEGLLMLGRERVREMERGERKKVTEREREKER